MEKQQQDSASAGFATHAVSLEHHASRPVGAASCEIQGSHQNLGTSLAQGVWSYIVEAITGWPSGRLLQVLQRAMWQSPGRLQSQTLVQKHVHLDDLWVHGLTSGAEDSHHQEGASDAQLARRAASPSAER